MWASITVHHLIYSSSMLSFWSVLSLWIFLFCSDFTIIMLNLNILSSPNCRSEYEPSEAPERYFCFCGKTENPQVHPWLIPHSCGETCEKPLQPFCGHYCLLLCHPGMLSFFNFFINSLSFYIKSKEPQTLMNITISFLKILHAMNFNSVKYN